MSPRPFETLTPGFQFSLFIDGSDRVPPDYWPPNWATNWDDLTLRQKRTLQRLNHPIVPLDIDLRSRRTLAATQVPRAQKVPLTPELADLSEREFANYLLTAFAETPPREFWLTVGDQVVLQIPIETLRNSL